MGRIIKLKSFFLDLLSFNSPKAIVINLSSIFIILASIPTEFLNYSPVKCVFKTIIFPLIFGGVCPEEGFFAYCNCPACGMTRAMSRLLHGDLVGAYGFNKLVFIVFIIMVIVLITNLYKINKKN